jgi:EAL domain-containing protein (putative c-di-GMP-specific phosphodiesterase class I)/GGDEF domain-containing protein/PAS domain-containing protein
MVEPSIDLLGESTTSPGIAVTPVYSEAPSSTSARAQWLLPSVEAVTSVMCSAAPLQSKIKASCAALVDHAMASGAWLMGPSQDSPIVMAAESEDEELHPILSSPGLNELLMRRMRQLGQATERSFDPLIHRQFDALGFPRDFVVAPLVSCGKVIGTLHCLFRSDLKRLDQELQAIEIIARIMAVALKNAPIENAKVRDPSSTATTITLVPKSKPAAISDELRLETVTSLLPGAVVSINLHGIVTQVVPGSLLTSPLPLKKAGNQGWLFNFSTDHAQQSQQAAIRKALRGEMSSCQFQVGDWTGSNDSMHIIEQNFSPVKNGIGEVVEVIGYAHDITEKITMSETLRQLREHDPITDCMTLGALREHAEKEMSVKDKRNELVFYTIEIEKFGSGIHLLGQSSFEELLQTVVARIRRQLPKMHFLARRGDHSFVAVARFDPEIDSESHNGQTSANNIVQVLNDPIVTGRYEYFIAASVGYSHFPSDGGTLDEMFYNADIAAMESSRQRHNMALAFVPSMASEANERVRIETALHRAVDHEEFHLAYQPKVDLQTGEVTGVEALIRWPGRTNMSPAKFIPIAEECGLISFIGEWALRQSCKVAMSWYNAGHVIPISVNVSTRQFQDSDFHDIVEDILRETGCRPELIELEVTEGVMIRDPEAAISIFNDLKKLGVKISIDDFGMGFSSLSYLKNLPVDKLKIDRTFVAGLPHEKDNEAITKAILAMADAMGLRTVAEGVEEIECLEHLRGMGCHEIQGYYFSKPLFEQEFMSWLFAYESVQKLKAA